MNVLSCRDSHFAHNLLERLVAGQLCSPDYSVAHRLRQGYRRAHWVVNGRSLPTDDKSHDVNAVKSFWVDRS